MRLELEVEEFLVQRMVMMVRGCAIADQSALNFYGFRRIKAVAEYLKMNIHFDEAIKDENKYMCKSKEHL